MTPSVTTILNPYIDSQWFTEESAKRGTAVHSACACWLQGLWIPTLTPEIRLYFDSFKKWADQTIDKVVLVETRLYDSELDFSGKPDMIVVLKGDAQDQFTLPDLKTSQAYQKWWILQDAGYRHLAKKDRNITCYRGLSVRVKKDGSGCVINEHPRDYRAGFNVFLGLLNANKFFTKREEK